MVVVVCGDDVGGIDVVVDVIVGMLVCGIIVVDEKAGDGGNDDAKSLVVNVGVVEIVVADVDAPLLFCVFT